MRPKSIRWFDGLFVSALALELVLRISYIREALYFTNNDNTSFFVGVAVLDFIVPGAFWFAISRLVSNVAKWLWVILLASVPITLLIVMPRPGALYKEPFTVERAIFEIVRPLLYIGATIMLFRSDAKTWFAIHRRRPNLSNVS